MPPLALIVGLGLTLVIAAGEIDLSFPSVIKMSGVVFAMLCKEYVLIWLFAFLAVLVGACWSASSTACWSRSSASRRSSPRCAPCSSSRAG